MAALDERIERIRDRLLSTPEEVDRDNLVPDWAPPVPHARPPVDAAVLMPIIRRDGYLSMLYTQRSPSLRSHSGQIAFPGGKLDPDDGGPVDAALREASEEVALNPHEAEVLGFMPSIYTGSNYLITPVVAIVEPSTPFVANPAEVDEVFEVPLPHLALLQSYGTFHVERLGQKHTTWQIDHEGRIIWGITGNLTRKFRDDILREEAPW